MTRASKRKSDDQNSEPIKRNCVDSVRSVLWSKNEFNVRHSCLTIKVESIPNSSFADSKPSFPASNKAAIKVQERIDKIYTKYANQSSCMIDPEGIEALCSDLKVNYTDVKILMLAWKMEAQRQGYFTLDEWRKGFKNLRVDTIAKLKKKLPELEKEVLKSENFEDFYQFGFRYCLTEDKQKCLDIETSCILLELILKFQYQPQVDLFVKFLKIQSEYKAINMDQWTNFHRFCQEISFPDLKNYNSGEAWPILLDNFADWIKEEAQI